MKRHASLEWTLPAPLNHHMLLDHRTIASVTPYKAAEINSNSPSPFNQTPRREEDDHDDGFQGRQQA
jgi:hypothetical protein